ncbi:hypothetical protein JTB14_020631 [Gonioctena quinquepunctata]|nr:hypothetical protein JTB14_020631 [Gonioctena quinquepunctata]
MEEEYVLNQVMIEGGAWMVQLVGYFPSSRFHGHPYDPYLDIHDGLNIVRTRIRRRKKLPKVDIFLVMLEDDAKTAETVDEIMIFPPENATAEVINEDSGTEEIFTIGNLPVSQLQAPAEIPKES